MGSSSHVVTPVLDRAVRRDVNRFCAFAGSNKAAGVFCAKNSSPNARSVGAVKTVRRDAVGDKCVLTRLMNRTALMLVPPFCIKLASKPRGNVRPRASWARFRRAISAGVPEEGGTSAVSTSVVPPDFGGSGGAGNARRSTLPLRFNGIVSKNTNTLGTM